MHSNIYCKITTNLVKLLNSWLFLPAARKLGQGNIFTSVCLSTGGVVVCLFWGASSKFWGVAPNFRGGGVPPNFGGISLIFRGSPYFRGFSNFSGGLQFFGGSPNLFFFFFNFFSPKKHSSGMHHPNTPPTPPLPPRRSMRSQYASYWNAFLFYSILYYLARQSVKYWFNKWS